jgi:hypothetical protein
MIPTGFPPVAASITLGDLFGPLAPLALIAALAALVVLMALLAGEYTISAMRRGSDAVGPQQPTPASPQPPTRISHAA